MAKKLNASELEIGGSYKMTSSAANSLGPRKINVCTHNTRKTHSSPSSWVQLGWNATLKSRYRVEKGHHKL